MTGEVSSILYKYVKGHISWAAAEALLAVTIRMMPSPVAQEINKKIIHNVISSFIILFLLFSFLFFFLS